MPSNLELLENRNILAWMMHHNIKNERGMPMEFEDHSFMIDPFLDWTPLQGVRKASQCGWSTMTNLKLFWSARHGIPGYVAAANVIYTLPSDSDVNVFVPSKTNQLIKQNPIIQQYLMDPESGKVDVDSIGRKKIDNSMVYFKGTRSKTAAIMLTSDLNIHDESDRSEKFIVDEYESRLANSLYKGRWIFSNPDKPNMPADLMFLDSDQKHWFIKHEACGHWQYLDWIKLSEIEFVSGSMHCYVDDSMVTADGKFKPMQYICGKCARPISDENRKRGRWIKKYANKEVSGYWVTHFMYPKTTAQQIGQVEKKKSKAYFMNFVRGLPYVGSDVVVDSRTIVNNIVLDKPKWERGKVAMGVDNGDDKWYVIGNEEGIFEYGTTKHWEDIETLIRKYEPVTVIDQNPYPAAPRELANKYRPAHGKLWRVYLSIYIQQSKNYELIDWGIEDKAHMVYPVRDLLFDDLVAYIHAGNIRFFGPKSYWERYIAHWETMYRGDFIGVRRAAEMSLNEPHDQARGVWLSSTGMNHLAHATLYWYVAMSRVIQGQGHVLQGKREPLQELTRDVGGVPTVPDVQNGVMSYGKKKFMPDLKRLTQIKTRKSGSLSDTIK